MSLSSCMQRRYLCGLQVLLEILKKPVLDHWTIGNQSATYWEKCIPIAWHLNSLAHISLFIINFVRFFWFQFNIVRCASCTSLLHNLAHTFIAHISKSNTCSSDYVPKNMINFYVVDLKTLNHCLVASVSFIYALNLPKKIQLQGYYFQYKFWLAKWVE